MRLAGCWLLLLGAVSLRWTTTKGERAAEEWGGKHWSCPFFYREITHISLYKEFRSLGM